MTFKLHRCVTGATLRRLVPRRYHPQIKWSEFADAKTAALLFEHKRKEVVTHTMVQQTLDAIGPLDEPFKVAVAANLTHEAAELLAASGFTVPLKTQVPKVPPQTQSIPFPEPQSFPWTARQCESLRSFLCNSGMRCSSSGQLERQNKNRSPATAAENVTGQ